MYETLCTIADMGVEVYVYVYVYVWDGIQVRYMSISASLTLFLAVMSAPFSRSRQHKELWPLPDALCNAVEPC